MKTIENSEVKVRVSSACLAEKKYVVRVLLEEFLGLCVSFEHKPDIKGIEITCPSKLGTLRIKDDFFELASDYWLEEKSLPNDEVWCRNDRFSKLLGEENIPVIYGEKNEDGTWWHVENGVGELGIDIFGSSFFYLSRYEEAVASERDGHDRFPSDASVSSKWGILHRPVVNEYLEILWDCAKEIWPHLERTPRDFRILPSHDIDWPYLFMDVSMLSAFKNFLRGVKRTKLSDMVTWSWRYVLYRLGNYAADPYNTIQWIIDQSDKRGLKSAFYYIPQQTHSELDPQDYLDRKDVMNQWQKIITQGHEIGVHPGYETYLSEKKIKVASDRIRLSLEKLGHTEQKQLGGRQHFLRWKTPDTSLHWENAGLNYDSTLGYADKPGFRCGVCYEYPLYDFVNRRTLKLRERPLIVMDCSVIDQQYMGLGTGESALAVMSDLKQTCRSYDGDFTILWHNQRFEVKAERDLYIELLDS